MLYKRNIMKNKRGWIRIVEAFVAVLLITGIVLIVIDKGHIKKEDSSNAIYETENSILRMMQENNSLREETINSIPPINSSDSNFPALVKNMINANTPAYLECLTKICLIEDNCLYEGYVNEDIYSRSVIITSDLTNYSPKQVKLFCFKK